MKYNTECVFEVIGNYPVVDQFEVSYPSLLSGSMQDNYVTGSMFTTTKLLPGLPPITSQGNRRLAFSKLGIDRASKPDGTYSLLELQKASYVTQPWYERAGTIKNIKIFSDAERYYDSCPPNIDGIVKSLGGEFYWAIIPELMFFSMGRGTSADFTQDVNESFPFEPKFSNVNRMKENLNTFTATKDTTLNPIEPKNSKSLVIFSHVGFLNPPFTTDAVLWSASNTEDSSKLFFGFGDLKTQAYDLLDPTIYKSIDTPMWRELDLSTAIPAAIGPVIRGWKYGLVSGTPKYTGAVFRRTRFGQFRDMLEQREIPVGIQDHEYSPFKYLGSVEQPAVPISDVLSSNPVVDIADYTVKVNFLRKDYNSTTKTISYSPVNPEQTMSSNYSMHATSSLPFFDDGKPRNRLPRTGPDNLLGNNVKIGLAFDLNNPIIT